jgi:hypothetical protein
MKKARTTDIKWLELGKVRDAARRLDHWMIEFQTFLQQIDDRADLYPEVKAKLRTEAYQETRRQIHTARQDLAAAVREVRADVETRLPSIPSGYGRAEAVSERAYWLNLAQSSLGGDAWSVLHTLRRDLPGAPPLARDTFLRVAEGAIARDRSTEASQAFREIKRQYMSDGERKALARRAAVDALETRLAFSLDGPEWGLAAKVDDTMRGRRDHHPNHYGELMMHGVEETIGVAGDNAYASTFSDGAGPQDAAGEAA